MPYYAFVSNLMPFPRLESLDDTSDAERWARRIVHSGETIGIYKLVKVAEVGRATGDDSLPPEKKRKSRG